MAKDTTAGLTSPLTWWFVPTAGYVIEEFNTFNAKHYGGGGGAKLECSL